MNVVIPNKCVACEPFPEDAQGVKRVQVGKGLVGMEQKTTLTGLKVVFGDDECTLVEGDTAFVLGESVKDLWAARVMTLPGSDRRFILVPLSSIQAIGRPDLGSEGGI